MRIQKVLLLDNCPWNDNKDIYEVRLLDKDFKSYKGGDKDSTITTPNEEEQIMSSGRLAQISVDVNVSIIRGPLIVSDHNHLIIAHIKKEATNLAYQLAKTYAQELAKRENYPLVDLTRRALKETGLGEVICQAEISSQR